MRDRRRLSVPEAIMIALGLAVIAWALLLGG
jgi:hypothetical protein